MLNPLQERGGHQRRALGPRHRHLPPEERQDRPQGDTGPQGDTYGAAFRTVASLSSYFQKNIKKVMQGWFTYPNVFSKFPKMVHSL